VIATGSEVASRRRPSTRERRRACAWCGCLCETFDAQDRVPESVLPRALTRA